MTPTPIDFNILDLEVINTDSNGKLIEILRKNGFEPKNYDWKRFIQWLYNSPPNIVDKIIIPNRPTKTPLAAILKEFAGQSAVQTYIESLYHAKWLQTASLINTDIEKFVKLWTGTEYATKREYSIGSGMYVQILESVCASIISSFNRWGLDRGPQIVNSFFRILLNLGNSGNSAPATFKDELGALFLQSFFFDDNVRRCMERFTSCNYIKLARALNLPQENIEKLDNGYLIKVDTKIIDTLNADQKAFIQIEDKWNSNPKNKARYVIHDLSLSPEQAFFKAWKICLGTTTLRPEAFITQIMRILPLVGTEEAFWTLALSQPVIDGICEYIRDLGTPGLGLILGAMVDYLLGQSIDTQKDYYHFLNRINIEYSTKYPNMVSPKATYYMMIIAVGADAHWAQFKAILPKLQYVNKLPDMIDSERLVFDLSLAKNIDKFKKIVDDILLPEKDKLVWNDPKVLLMILKTQGYDKFMEFKFSDQKIQDVYELIAKISPKSPYLKLLASKNMKIRNEVFANIEKRMMLGGLDPIKFCDPSRNLADLPPQDVPDKIKGLFGRSFDDLKLTQWRQDVIGSKGIYVKADWMLNTFVTKVEQRAHAALATHTHSVHSMVAVTNALRSSAVDKIISLFPEGSLKNALKVDGPKDVAELVKLTDNLSKEHHPGLSLDSMIKILDAIEAVVHEKADKTEDEINNQSAIRLGICDIISKWTEIRTNDADKLFAHIKLNPFLKPFVIDYFANYSAVQSLVKLLNSSVIKPLKEVTPEDMRILLKYNNVTLPTENKLTPEQLEKFDTLAQVLDVRNQAKLVWRDLNVKKVDLSDDEKLEKSADMDKYNKGKHGDIAIKILDEYDVAIPAQVDSTAKWDEAHKDSKVMIPVFHGTGSIAASFILRFGFAIIQGGDGVIKTAGKMLGDGIYFSTVLDKVGQYVGDVGFTRGHGTKGYIFEMRANLGEETKNYACAGVDGTDGIQSPEWCVFTPNSQLKIYKAYQIELISKNEMRDMKGKYLTNKGKVAQADAV